MYETKISRQSLYTISATLNIYYNSVCPGYMKYGFSKFHQTLIIYFLSESGNHVLGFIMIFCGTAAKYIP